MAKAKEKETKDQTVQAQDAPAAETPQAEPAAKAEPEAAPAAKAEPEAAAQKEAETPQAEPAAKAEPEAAPAAKAEPEAAAQKETVKFPAFIEENPVFMIPATLDCAAAALRGIGAAIRENGKEREPAPEDVLAVGFKDGVAVIVTVDGQKFTIKADTGNAE